MVAWRIRYSGINSKYKGIRFSSLEDTLKWKKARLKINKMEKDRNDIENIEKFLKDNS